MVEVRKSAFLTLRWKTALRGSLKLEPQSMRLSEPVSSIHHMAGGISSLRCLTAKHLPQGAVCWGVTFRIV